MISSRYLTTRRFRGSITSCQKMKRSGPLAKATRSSFSRGETRIVGPGSPWVRFRGPPLSMRARSGSRPRGMIPTGRSPRSAYTHWRPGCSRPLRRDGRSLTSTSREIAEGRRLFSDRRWSTTSWSGLRRDLHPRATPSAPKIVGARTHRDGGPAAVETSRARTSRSAIAAGPGGGELLALAGSSPASSHCRARPSAVNIAGAAIASAASSPASAPSASSGEDRRRARRLTTAAGVRRLVEVAHARSGPAGRAVSASGPRLPGNNHS